MTKRGLFGAGISPPVQLRAHEMILPERIAMALREGNQTIIHSTGRFDFVPYGSLDPESLA